MIESKSGHIKHKILPLSLRGVVLAMASLVFLVQGILRADLTGIFWGSGFFLLVLLTVIGNLVYMIFLRGSAVKKHIVADLKLASHGIFPGETSQAHHKIELPRFAVPGFSLTAQIKLHWPEREPIILKGPISPGPNRYTLDFKAVHRGIYTSRYLEIDLFDFLGFSRSFLQIPLKESLRVFPDRQEVVFSPKASEDEKNIEFNQDRTRSDELLEVKKYYPGDDHRKLNWKIFAHTGELFVRKGEEIPPPESNFCFLLFTGRSSLVKENYQIDALDLLIASVSQAMTGFQDKGYPVLLAVNDQPTTRPFSSSQPRDLLKYLSGLSSSENTVCPEIPELNKKELLIFSLPGTQGLETFLKPLGAAKSLSLFLKELPVFSDNSKQFDWKKIFYNIDSSKEMSWFSGKITEDDYRFHLNREMLLYQGRGGKVQIVQSF